MSATPQPADRHATGDSPSQAVELLERRRAVLTQQFQAAHLREVAALDAAVACRDSSRAGELGRAAGAAMDLVTAIGDRLVKIEAQLGRARRETLRDNDAENASRERRKRDAIRTGMQEDRHLAQIALAEARAAKAKGASARAAAEPQTPDSREAAMRAKAG